MKDIETTARKALEAHLPGDITPEEIEMMVWLQTLLSGRKS